MWTFEQDDICPRKWCGFDVVDDCHLRSSPKQSNGCAVGSGVCFEGAQEDVTPRINDEIAGHLEEAARLLRDRGADPYRVTAICVRRHRSDRRGNPSINCFEVAPRAESSTSARQRRSHPVRKFPRQCAKDFGDSDSGCACDIRDRAAVDDGVGRDGIDLERDGVCAIGTVRIRWRADCIDMPQQP